MIQIYTDGGCQKNPGKEGSWSFVVVKNNKIIFSKTSTKIYKKDITSNKMELQAISEALKFAKNKKIKKIEIFSDSKYIVNCFSGIFKIHKNKEQWDIINGYKKGFLEIKINWIKGHSINQFNNKADINLNLTRLILNNINIK